MIRELPLPIGLYSLLAAIWLRGVLPVWTSAIHGSTDAFNRTWRIWWFAGGHREWSDTVWFAPHIFHPVGHFLTEADLSPLNMVPAVVVSRLFGPVAAWNTMIFASFVLAGLGAYLFVRSLGTSPAAALFAGLVFSFSPYHTAHAAGHLPLMGMWVLPYGLWAVERLKEAQIGGERRRVWAWSAAVGTAVGLAAWSAWYYLFIFGIAFAVYGWFRVPVAPLVRLKRLAVPGLIAVVVAGVMIAPEYAVMKANSSDQELTWTITKIKGAAPYAYVLPSSVHQWWGSAMRPLYGRNPGENALFLGWLPLGLAYYALRGREKGGVRSALLGTSIVFFVLSLGPFLYLWDRIPPTIPIAPAPWMIEMFPAAAEVSGLPIPMPGFPFAFLPGLSGMREWTRFGVVVSLCVATLAAFGIDRLLASDWMRKGDRLRPIGAVVLALALALVLLEFAPRSGGSDATPRPVDRYLAAQAGDGAVIWLPDPPSVADEEIFRTIQTGKPIAFGDTSFLPPHYEESLELFETFPDAAAIERLEELEVEWIVWRREKFGPMPTPIPEGISREVSLDGYEVWRLDSGEAH